MTKPTGKPRGRPKGSTKAASTAYKARERVDFGLTAEQVANLEPIEVLALCTRSAILRGDAVAALDAAKAWAPYVHVKPQQPVELSEDDIRRIAEVARVEALRRGYGSGIASLNIDGAHPN